MENSPINKFLTTKIQPFLEKVINDIREENVTFELAQELFKFYIATNQENYDDMMKFYVLGWYVNENLQELKDR